MQGVDAMHLLESEAQEVFQRAGRTLELLVAKPDRPNTPVRVPETIRLTATPEPDRSQDDHDHDADGRNQDDDEDDEDEELLRRRVVDTYYRMRQDGDDGRQPRVVREDSWWIQGDREDDGNVRPTDKQRALAGWPLAVRRNSEGAGGRRERSADRPASTTLPRRTKSLRGRRSPDRPTTPATAPVTMTTRTPLRAQPPATAPAIGGDVSPFQLKFEEALNIIERCRAQLDSRPPTRTSRTPPSPACRPSGWTPDLIDLHTELDPKYVMLRVPVQQVKSVWG